MSELQHPTPVEVIEKSFTYQAPKPGQPELYKELRDQAKELGLTFVNKVPNSRERSLAITRLEEAVMWANKAIALHG